MSNLYSSRLEIIATLLIIKTNLSVKRKISGKAQREKGAGVSSKPALSLEQRHLYLEGPSDSGGDEKIFTFPVRQC